MIHAPFTQKPVNWFLYDGNIDEMTTETLINVRKLMKVDQMKPEKSITSFCCLSCSL